MSDKKNILLVSNFCYPEISPRAFRTTELAREFARLGHSVTLVIPNKEIYHKHPLTVDGVTVLLAEGPEENESNNSVARNSPFKRLMPRFVQKAVLYFYCHELFVKYNPGIYRRLLELDRPFDAVISVSYPAAVHLAVARAVRRNPNLRGAVKIAEFSDPPFKGDIARDVFPGYYNYLKRWGRLFDYFVTPVEKGLPCYTPYMDPERVKVIPQGFDMTAVRRRSYHPNPVPAFAYAGRFYDRIRDPQFFFDFLRTVEGGFRFDLYMNHLDGRFAEMIEEARRSVRGEIVLHDSLPREALIEELSAEDFLINFDNTTANATPSKLIDYAMTGRPIFSFNGSTFDPETFRAVLRGDYSSQVTGIDLEQYDIRNVAGQFMELIDPKRS